MMNFLKVSSVILAGFLSWLVTSSIVAQQRRPTRAAEGLSLKSVKTPATALDPAQAALAAPLGMAQLGNYKLTVANGKATVALDSLLVDHRPGISYIWRLRVIDDAKNALGDVWYDQQIFKVGESGATQPTFNEVFDLPAGAKSVSVMLYELHDGLNLEDFKQSSGKGKGGSLVFRGVAKVRP